MSGKIMNVRVDPDKLDELKEAVELDPEWDDMTEYIRWCVFEMGMDRWRVEDD